VQVHAADELDIEVALAERPLGGLTAGGEGRYQDIVEGLALLELFLEIGRAGAQLLVGELLQLRFQSIDLRHARLIGLDAALIGGAENLAGERADHSGIPFRSVKHALTF
jgi:hypothetical protein